MNKSICLFACACFLGSMVLTGCKKELKNVRGVVKTVIIDNDTLRSLTVMNGEDSIVFHLEDARFNNGLMVPRDSVIVDYIDGKNDTARALVVTVLPAAAKPIDLKDNKRKDLLTAPAEKSDSSNNQ